NPPRAAIARGARAFPDCAPPPGFSRGLSRNHASQSLRRNVAGDFGFHLDEQELPCLAVRSIQLHDRMTSRPRSCKRIQDQIIARCRKAQDFFDEGHWLGKVKWSFALG